MDRHSFPSIIVSSSLFHILILLFSSEKSLCLDPQYEACVPKMCGRLNISFPFYILGQQEAHCGYRGYGLNCTNGSAIITVSDNPYVIEQLVYGNSTFRVYNNALSSPTSSICVPKIKNFTLDTARFSFASNVSFMYLLSNCSRPLPGNLSCSAQTQCGSTVVAPVELDRDYGSNATRVYKQLLRRGFSLKWNASNCSECEGSGGRCGYDAETSSFLCYCSDGSHASNCTPGNKGQSLMPIIPGAAAGLVVVTLVILFCCFRKRFSRFLILKKREGNHNIEVFLKNHGELGPKRYTYSNVKKMTNSFKVKLGQGGYGSVYRGKLPDGNPVAVKVLSELKGNGQEFINEVASISRTSHVNIVTLLGFCVEGSKRALIYEFMANGSLEKFVFGGSEGSLIDRQLGWDKLYNIAVGIARGLEYLHRGCNTRILHFDIKPHNILLDENFCPKISDFGLAKICLKQESVLSKVTERGTIGYIAPEVYSRNFGRVSHKADVYSYGMMVLEMVSGRKNIQVEVDHTSEIYFPEWIYHRLELSEELGLQGITSEDENETSRKMIIASLWCIQTDPSDRPSMNKVVEMLEGSLESLEIPPKPFLSSPFRSPTDPSSVIDAS